MLDVTDATFEQHVLLSPTPVVVDFWARWCRPCDRVTAALEELEGEGVARIAFAKLDVDGNPLTAARYEILSLPSVVVFDGGEPMETIVGAKPRSTYERAIGRFS